MQHKNMHKFPIKTTPTFDRKAKHLLTQASLKENITQQECNELKRLMPKLIAKYREGL